MIKVFAEIVEGDTAFFRGELFFPIVPVVGDEIIICDTPAFICVKRETAIVTARKLHAKMTNECDSFIWLELTIEQI